MLEVENLIIACVKSGEYLLIADDVIIGDVKRVYSNDRYGFMKYTYHLTFRNHPGLYIYKTLPELEKDFRFSNFPGYNSILATPAQKAKNSSKRLKYVRHYTNVSTGERHV